MLNSAHTATDRERDKYFARHPFNCVVSGIAIFMACRDIEEGDFVGTLFVIAFGNLDGIAGITDIDKLDAFDNAAFINIETGNNAFGESHVVNHNMALEGGFWYKAHLLSFFRSSPMGLNRLQGKVAIITGGASGIGKGIVELFVAEGARVVIADINEAAGKETAAALGSQVRFRKTDVTSEADVKGLVDFAVSEFGRLDIMHNNAGAFGARGSALEIDADAFDKTFALLVKSVFLGMKHAGAVMKTQGGGVILNTASISATVPGYGPHIYQSAKAAVLALSKTVALEFAEFNVRVNCISPGGVYTPLIGNALGTDAATTAEIAKGMGKILPMNRAGTPLDIARAALFLCSDDAAYITSQNLIVDGAEGTGKKYKDQGIH